MAMWTAIFVFTDSVGLVHTRAVRRVRVEAAFPILLAISASSDGGAAVGELADSIEFVVVNANNRLCLCVLSQDMRIIQTDGQSEVLTGL